MADHENSVSVSIGFSETTFLHSCFECRSGQVCVFEGKHPVSTGSSSFAGTWLPCQEPAIPSQAPEWISVQGIAHLNPPEAERMLCTVRQLKLYLWESGGADNCSFIGTATWDIMRSHISRWIVETVKEAYSQADRKYHQVTVHEVRALSASWAYSCQVALLVPDLLSAAFWRSSGVFQNSYLRDMACITDGMSILGPVVVAQRVVDPGHLLPPP